jgi:putative addiction module component (TIGR02574 family)
LGSGLARYIGLMGKTEILAELPNLHADELAEIQAKLDELTGEVWRDDADLSEEEKAALDAALVDYRKDPDSGSTWEEVKARIQDKLSA